MGWLSCAFEKEWCGMVFKHLKVKLDTVINLSPSVALWNFLSVIMSITKGESKYAISDSTTNKHKRHAISDATINSLKQLTLILWRGYQLILISYKWAVITESHEQVQTTNKYMGDSLSWKDCELMQLNTKNQAVVYFKEPRIEF